MRIAIVPRLVLLLSCVPLSAAALDASRTAMFRGNPQLTGVYETRPVYAVDGVKFTFDTGGPIRSTPAIIDGVLYVGSADGNFYAVDAKSGAERWRFKTGGGISSSPAVSGGNAFFSSRDGFLYAVDTRTGRQRWRLPLGKDLGERNYWDYYLSSPVVAGQTLFIGAGNGHVRAVDIRNGKVRWSFPTSARVRATPAVSGDNVVFATMDGHVYAVGAKDGAQRWKFATQGAGNKFEDNGNDTTSVSASPSVSDGIVTVGGRDGFAYGINLADGSLRWKITHDGSSWILATAIADGTAYIASGSAMIVQAVDLKSGVEKWRHKTGGAVFSSLTIAGDVLYFADLGGNIEAIDKATGARRWIYSLPDRVFSTPVVADGVVYCGADNGTLTALDGSAIADAARAAPRRIVYWEGRKSEKAFSWFQNNVDAAILSYFKSAGYEQLDAAQLAAFMAEQIKLRSRSVVVFADNKIPSSVVEEATPSALIRKYLDAGGKVALLGANPLAFRADPVTGVVEDVDFTAAQDVFGVTFPAPETSGGYYASRPTDEGKRWGLRGSMVGSGAIDPAQASSVLAVDEYGMASAWVKNYGGADGTGLLQLSVPRSATTEFSRYRAAIEHGLY
jgi:outer membrane protein assembly factor BamB